MWQWWLLIQALWVFKEDIDWMQCLWSSKNCEWHDVPTSIAWEDPLFIHGKCGVQALQKVASRRTAPRLRENTKKTHLWSNTATKHSSTTDLHHSCGSARFHVYHQVVSHFHENHATQLRVSRRQQSISQEKLSHFGSIWPIRGWVQSRREIWLHVMNQSR